MSDKENTFRALADKPLIANRWTCRFGWHRWGHWGDPQKDIVGHWHQARFCVDCNLYKTTRVQRPGL